MKKCKRTGLGKCVLALCVAGMLVSIVATLPSPLLAKEQLNVTRDNEKTVYSIDSSDRIMQEDKEERDRAWQMLNNMPIILDNRQSVPVRPAPAK
jgi:hypothetical protein